MRTSINATNKIFLDLKSLIIIFRHIKKIRFISTNPPFKKPTP